MLLKTQKVRFIPQNIKVCQIYYEKVTLSGSESLVLSRLPLLYQLETRENYKHSVLPDAETMAKDCAFHTSPALVPSECWQRYCFLLKSRVILRLSSLFKSWVFWKDAWWCCSYWDQHYDLIIWKGFCKFWSYADLGYWFQKEKDGVVVS